MDTTQVPAFMQSSTDATQVSSRITGGVLACSSIIILLAQQFFHITLSSYDVISLATEVGIAGGAIWALKGTIIWVMTKFGKKNAPVITVTPVTTTVPPTV